MEDPAMFRSVSTRGGPSSKYEKLEKDNASNGTSNYEEELKRSTSVPSREASSYNYGDMNLQRNPTKKSKDNSHSKEKSHPIFSFFDLRRKKKKKTPTATPEMTRYMEYLKEGGMWDSDSNKPVIYYK